MQSDESAYRSASLASSLAWPGQRWLDRHILFFLLIFIILSISSVLHQACHSLQLFAGALQEHANNTFWPSTVQTLVGIVGSVLTLHRLGT